MEKTLNRTKSSDLYRKIAALPLAPEARAKALGAATIAEGLVGLFVRLTGLAKPASARLGTPKAA